LCTAGFAGVACRAHDGATVRVRQLVGASIQGSSR
jgi:hypothetical protein